MTQQTSRAASSPPLLLSPPLVGGLEIVRTLHLDLGIGGLLVWLQHFPYVQPLVKSRFYVPHAQEVDFLQVIFDE